MRVSEGAIAMRSRHEKVSRRLDPVFDQRLCPMLRLIGSQSVSFALSHPRHWAGICFVELQFVSKNRLLQLGAYLTNDL